MEIVFERERHTFASLPLGGLFTVGMQPSTVYMKCWHPAAPIGERGRAYALNLGNGELELTDGNQDVTGVTNYSFVVH